MILVVSAVSSVFLCETWPTSRFGLCKFGFVLNWVMRLGVCLVWNDWIHSISWNHWNLIGYWGPPKKNGNLTLETTRIPLRKSSHNRELLSFGVTQDLLDLLSTAPRSKPYSTSNFVYFESFLFLSPFFLSFYRHVSTKTSNFQAKNHEGIQLLVDTIYERR